MAGSYSLLATTISTALLAGFIPVLFELLQDTLRQRLGLPDEGTRRLHRLGRLALILALPLAGLLTDSWGCAEVLFSGLVMTAVSLTGLGLAQESRLALAAALGLGLGGAGVLVSALVLMPQAFSPGDLPASAVNLGFVFVGLGSVLGPLLFRPVLERAGFRQTLLLLALSCLIPATCAALTPAGEFPVPRAGGDMSHFLTDYRFYVLALAFFLYYPLERTMRIWADPFLNEVGFVERRRTTLWVFFFLAFLGTRFWLGFITEPKFAQWYLLICAVLMMIVLANLPGLFDVRAVGAGLVLLGAFTGPIFPTLAGLVLGLFRSEPATAFGCAVIAGPLGYAAFKPALRYVMTTKGPRSAIKPALGLSLLFLMVVLVLAVTVAYETP